jgi:hypothetical protein
LLCPNEQLAQYYYDKGDFESKKSVMKNFKRDTLKILPLLSQINRLFATIATI